MELKTYVDILTRRWRVGLYVMLAVSCLAALAGLFVSPKYQAEVRLRVVTPLGGSVGETYYQTTFAARLMNTYAQIATSEQVNQELRNKLDINILPAITVKIIPDSEVIQIVAESDDAALAAQTANTLAEILLDYQDNAFNNTEAGELKVLTDRMQELESELTQYQQQHDELAQQYAQSSSEIAVLDRTIKLKETSYQNMMDQYERVTVSEMVSPTSTLHNTRVALEGQILQLEEDLDTLNQKYKALLADSNRYQQQLMLVRQSLQNTQSTYDDLRYRYDAVILANYRQDSARNIVIFSPASTPTEPNSPGMTLLLGVGIILGGVMGILAAFVVEMLDTRFFTLEQVEGESKLPILGTLSTFNAQESSNAEDLKMQRDLWMLSAKVRETLRDGSLKTVMVTSADIAEGKSIMVHGLALELARGGLKVLVVDTNLRRPIQHVLFDVLGQYGLNDYLGNASRDVKSMLLKDIKPGLDLLPCFAPCESPAELLESTLFQDMSSVFKNYDVVLFDASSFLYVSDSLGLAKKVDGVVVMVELENTTRWELQELYNQFVLLGIHPLGVVVDQPHTAKPQNTHHPRRPNGLLKKAKKFVAHPAH